jgi:hypothetical protein
MAQTTKGKTHNKIEKHTHMKTKTQTENIAELVGLLSQAIDILRNHDAEDDANYIENQMESVIQKIKKPKK